MVIYFGFINSFSDKYALLVIQFLIKKYSLLKSYFTTGNADILSLAAPIGINVIDSTGLLVTAGY